MTGTIWAKFYWSDWSADPKLRLCSLAAQGLWMRMLCIAAESDPVGYVALDGKTPIKVEELASLVGQAAKVVKPLLAELKSRGVFSVDRRGVIYSRRMLADARKREVAVENGKQGGNPSLGKDRRKNRWVNPHMPEAISQNRFAPQGGYVPPYPKEEWKGPPEIWELCRRAQTLMALKDFRWRDLPAPAIVTDVEVSHMLLEEGSAGPRLASMGIKVLLERPQAATG